MRFCCFVVVFYFGGVTLRDFSQNNGDANFNSNRKYYRENGRQLILLIIYSASVNVLEKPRLHSVSRGDIIGDLTCYRLRLNPIKSFIFMEISFCNTCEIVEQSEKGKTQLT